MGKDSKIEYIDSSVNPVMGCDGCELWNSKVKTCYAGQLHERYSGVNDGFAKEFTKPQKYAGRMKSAAAWSDLRGKERPGKPWMNGLPRIIFISDMGDALSNEIDFEFLAREIIENVASEKGSRHFWLWFTKRPGRMRMFDNVLARNEIDWPDNLMPFTSITSEKTKFRASLLGDLRARYKGISFEPLLGRVDIEYVLDACADLSWVITGGESGTETTAERAMRREWMEEIREKCFYRGIPHFFKQWGEYVDRGKEGFERKGKAAAGREIDEHGNTLSMMPEIKFRW